MATVHRKPVLLAAACAVLASAAGASPPPGPSADNATPDLICHTSDPAECYPRVFEPTDEFRVVHDDQDLPIGLHVRLDVSTGRREAKINVPDEELDPALHGLPVDQAVLVVEPERERADDTTPRIPEGAPRYDPVGKIKPPAGHEATTFAEAFRMLKAGRVDDERVLDAALEGMEELSHDIFYGLQIAEDRDVVKALLCMMSGEEEEEREKKKESEEKSEEKNKEEETEPHLRADAADGEVQHVPRDQQAAAILAGALSNNAAALAQVAKAWEGIMADDDDDAAAACPGPRGGRPRDRFEASLAPRRPAQLKAKVAAVKGLLRDSSIREYFLRTGGMPRLLLVLCQEGAAWRPAQRKVGQLVLDTFLDEDMGAQPGQWPRTPRASTTDSLCAGDPPSSLADGCWEHHVARIARSRDGQHHDDNDDDDDDWSRELQRQLARARAREAAAGAKAKAKNPHDEL